MAASIREIARLTGLSTATVSHVINGTRPVSEESRALVERVIQETGYRPNRAARMLKTQKSNTVALVIPSVMPGRSTNLFFMNVISGAQDTLEARGYDLVVSAYTEESEGDARAQAAILGKNWGDGLLIVPGRRHSRTVELAQAVGVPFVLIDRTVEGADCPCVYSDNYAATRKAIRLLYESGKRHIAYIGGMLAFSTGHDRYRAYRDELAALALPYREELVFHNVEYTIDSAYTAAGEALNSGADAIFTANNILTMGVLKQLRDRKISVPDPVGVIGYEDYEWMEIMDPPITTIRQQSYALGAVGAEMLLAQLENREFVREQVLEAPLVIRKSHGSI